MKKLNKVGPACAIGLLASLSAEPAAAAQAQDATPAVNQAPAAKKTDGAADASTELQQVTVTAQRRATLLQDTPISVQAITARQLENQGLRSIDDLARVMPGVNFTRSGTSGTGNFNDQASEIAVRGIASTAGASTTGVYIDDTPIQTRHLSFSSVAPFPALFDLERVEMLRGPQGTLFGAGSEGGAVRFIQPEPGLTEDALYAHTELASTRGGALSYEAGTAFSTPIVPDVAGLRISASYRREGGYVDRVNVDPSTGQAAGTTKFNANQLATSTLRAAVKLAAGRDTSVIASVYHQRSRLDDTSAYWTALSDPGSHTFLNGNAQSNPSIDPFTLWSVKVNSDLGWATLSSSTSYFSRDQSGSSDMTQILGTSLLGNPYATGPGSAGGPATAYFTDAQRNVMEEVKLQSNDAHAALTWVAGMFLSRQHETTRQRIYGAALADTLGIAPTPGYADGLLLGQGPYSAIDKQAALFGQADWKMTGALTLTAGLRVATIHTAGNASLVGPLAGGAPPVSSKLSETPITPKLGLSWKPAADDMYYLSAAKGYRTGGINSGLGTLCAADLQTLGLANAPATYKSDSLWSYEAGAKNAYLNRRLQIDSSMFYVDWKNIQQSIYLPSCGDQFAANLGAATSKGGDVSIRFKPLARLVLTLDAAYTHTSYSRTVYASANGAGAPVVSAGNTLSPTPWNITVAADYQVGGFADVKPYLHADYQLNTRQQGKTSGQDPNNGVYDPGLVGLPATRNMSVRGGARWNGWDVSAFLNNLFDSAPEQVHQHDTVTSPLFFSRTWRPRTIGMTVNYRY